MGYALALVFLQSMPALQVTVIVAVAIAYYVMVLLWEPYKLKYANIFFAKAEFMFVIGLTLLLVIAYKKDDLEVDVHKTIGWGITFIFAFGWLRMIQLFFVRKLNQLSKKVLPKDGKKEAAKEGAKNKLDAIPAFEDYVKNGDRANRNAGVSRSRLGGKFVGQDADSNLQVDRLSEDSDSGEEISNVNESELSGDSLDIPDQSEMSNSQISKSQSVAPEIKDVESESESQSGSEINDEVSFDSDSEKSFEENELSEDDSDSAESQEGGLIGVESHGAEDKNVLKSKGKKSSFGGQVRVSSSHSKRSAKNDGALASKYIK